MARRTKKVLVVDDDQEQRARCRDILEGEGFEVLEGTSREDVHEVLDDQSVDVLILDLFLRDGPGYQLFNERPLNGTVVIGLTGVFQGNTVRRLLSRRYDFLELLDKPLSGAQLIELLRLHFGSEYPEAPASATVDNFDDLSGDDLSSVRSSGVYTVHSGLISLPNMNKAATPPPPPKNPPLYPHEEDVDAEDFDRPQTSPGRVDLVHRDGPDGTSLASNLIRLAEAGERVEDASIPPVPTGLDWKHVADRGELSVVSFAAVMARLLHTRFSGAIRLWGERVRKIIYFDDGHLVAVRSNLLYECLGRLLISKGLIDEATSEAAIKRARQSDARTGEVLLEMKALSPKALEQVLRDQLELRVLDIFSWTRGHYQIHASTDIFRATLLSHSATTRLILRGVLEHARLERIMRDLVDYLPYRLHTRKGSDGLDQLRLQATQAPILESIRMSDHNTLLELVARFEENVQAYQVVYALTSLGYLAFEV